MVAVAEWHPVQRFSRIGWMSRVKSFEALNGTQRQKASSSRFIG